MKVESTAIRRNFTLPAFYFLAFLLTVYILVTDQNLKTDFGAVHPYFIHWYILGATGIIALIISIILFARYTRATVNLAWIWSLIMILVMLGDILTYKSVGFSTPDQFAQYLFGISKYPQSLNYMPGLYDVLFLVYVLMFGYGLFATRKHHSS